MGCIRTRMNLSMGRRQWKGDVAAWKCCRCENYFVVSRHEGEDLYEKEGVAPSTRYGKKWVVVQGQGCWTAAPGGGDRNDCPNRSVYRNRPCCLSLLAELLVAARRANRHMVSLKGLLREWREGHHKCDLNLDQARAM